MALPLRLRIVPFRLQAVRTVLVAAFVVWTAFAFSPAAAQNVTTNAAADTDAVQRGQYVFHLAVCEGCHTDKKNHGQRLAGGRAFKTDFGTFYTPNITPDPATGIGAWTFDDFKTALRQGRAPDGSHYFPSFPYTSYTHMSDADLHDLWAYLKVQPAVVQANRPHDLKAPFGWRWLVAVWKWLYFDPGPKPEWSRGRYIAEALSHCQECHTPRNALGGYVSGMSYAGTLRNPEGINVPNITPDKETGIGRWSEGDLKFLFTIGMLPDGDFVGGVMAESVTYATSKMTDADRLALMTHLKSLPAIHNAVKVKKAHKTESYD